MNLVQSKKVLDFLLANDFKPTSNIDTADYILFDTCIYTPATRENATKGLRKMLKYQKDKTVIALGCIKGIKDELKEKCENIIFIGVSELDKLNDIFKPVKKIEDVGYNTDSFSFDSFNSIFNKDKHEAWLRGMEYVIGVIISRGCKNKCSYCSIRKGIGDVKSKTANHIIKEIELSHILK